VLISEPASPEFAFQVGSDEAARYITAYFEHIHPLYPFLNREDFERKALAPGIKELVEADCVFSGLYHAVLALGCQYIGDQSFDPASSPSRHLFDLAKKCLPEILLTKATLIHLQVKCSLPFYFLGRVPGADNMIQAITAMVESVMLVIGASILTSDSGRLYS
jgi:hypothetical protein